MPRATTAAWLVMPPRTVRMPCADFMPSMSSGLVSRRTSTTFSPRFFHALASSAEKTILPHAAPGEAGRPRPITLPRFSVCTKPSLLTVASEVFALFHVTSFDVWLT